MYIDVKIGLDTPDIGGGGRRAEDVAILISIAQCQQRTILSNVSKVSKSAACVPNIWVVFDLSIKI